MDTLISTFNYMYKVIEFYSEKIEIDKKFVISKKDLLFNFKDIKNYLSKWGNIDLDEFVLLLNTINKGNILKYIKQEDLFGKKVKEDNDYIPSVELNFFSKEAINTNYSGLTINYNTYQTIYGNILVASISDYICYLQFLDNIENEKDILKKEFKEAAIIKKAKNIHIEAVNKINNPLDDLPIQLILNLTDFQEKVFKALVRLPLKDIISYTELATIIDSPKASRAVGTAISKNTIAVLIPCHRIVQASGKTGDYMWGSNRKKAIIIFELLSRKI